MNKYLNEQLREIVTLELSDKLILILTNKGYVITDAWQTDWLETDYTGCIKWACAGIFNINQHMFNSISDFVDSTRALYNLTNWR